MPHEVILGDANPLMLAALAELFDRDPRFSLVATARRGEDFLDACRRTRVRVAVADWGLPGLPGEELLARLRDREDAPRVVIYAAAPDPDLPRRAMGAGAAGFMARDGAPEELLDVAAAVAEGRMVFPFLDVRALARDPREALTARERAMLSALARGRTNAELAAEFGVSVNTVKFHLRNLYDKLGLRNRAQAIAFHYAQAPRGG
jgi:two-component system nitrate/nitrite response regulator NarP